MPHAEGRPSERVGLVTLNHSTDPPAPAAFLSRRTVNNGCANKLQNVSVTLRPCSAPKKKNAIKNVRVCALHFCTRVAQVRTSRTSRAIAICFNYFLRPSIIVECVQATGSELSLYFMWSSKTITYTHIIMLWRINCARAHRAMHRSSGQSVEFGPIARW